MIVVLVLCGNATGVLAGHFLWKRDKSFSGCWAVPLLAFLLAMMTVLPFQCVAAVMEGDNDDALRHGWFGGLGFAIGFTLAVYVSPSFPRWCARLRPLMRGLRQPGMYVKLMLTVIAICAVIITVKLCT